MKTYIITLLAAAALVMGCNKTNIERASKEFNQLPGPVQSAVRSTAPNAEIADVDETRFDGRLVYHVTFRDSDRFPAIWIAPDGTIVKQNAGRAMGAASDKTTVNRGSGMSDLSALPVAVQKEIEKNTPRADINSIRRFNQDGRVYYEVEYTGKNRNPSIQIAEDGTVLKSLSTETRY